MSLSPADARKLDPAPDVEPAQDVHPASKPRTTGDGYIDHGAQCDADEGGTNCFLLPAQRSRLIQSFQHRVIEASSRYQEAAQALQGPDHDGAQDHGAIRKPRGDVLDVGHALSVGRPAQEDLKPPRRCARPRTALRASGSPSAT